MTQRIEVPGMGLVEFPDGMSDEQIVAAIKGNKPAPSYSDVALNASPKAIAGTMDALLNTPSNLGNLVKAAYGTLAGLSGNTEQMPELHQPPNLARKAFESLGFINPNVQPQTTGQRLLDTSIQGATGAMMNPSGSIAGTLGLGATGALSGLAAQGTKEATGSDVLGLAAGIATPAAVAGLRDFGQSRLAEMSLKQAQNAPKDKALEAGLAAGYKVPPSTVNPSLKNKTIESIAGKAATQQDASLNNVEVTNKLARKALGLPDDAPLTPDVTKNVRDAAYQAGYIPVEQIGTVRAGKLYRDDLNAIVANYQGAARSFPGAVRDDVSKMVDGLRRKAFDAGDAIKMTRTLREDAGRNFANGDTGMGKAQKAAANAIENQIERQLPPSSPLLQNFRDARQLMAKSHTVEDAIKVGTGNVDANKIASELQAGAPLTGELRVIGEFANNFRKAVQTPQTVGSPGVSKVAAMAGMFMGGGGAAAVGPLGAAAGAIPLIAPPMARGMLMREGFQKGLQPDYSGGMMGSFGRLPELSSGLLGPAFLYSQENQ